ncbi:MAG: thioesterase family protein [Hyphomicrobiaceae bacterium]
MSNERTPPATRAAFRHFLTIPTRWGDNDLYGHVNNVVYYSYFDTIINRYLIDPGGLDIHASPVIGIAVETQCRFHRSFAYPEDVQAALAVGKLGTSSVRYEIGLFAPGEDSARAEGHFVHVFVDRATMRPVPIGDRMRTALAALARG